MRKYLVSILLIGLIGPLAYLGWSGSSHRANAQVGATPAQSATAPVGTGGSWGSSPTAAPEQNASDAKIAMAQQISQLQQTIQALQSDNRVAMTLPPELAQAPEDPTVIVADDTAAQAATVKIEAALASPASFEFKGVPLKEIVDGLKDLHKIEIHLDVAVLKETGVEPDSPITKSLKNISLRSALHLMLDDLQLKYVIHNEVLLITSPSKAESDEFMSTRIYPVKDLVLVRNEKRAIEIDWQPLRDTITQTIATKTWQENGGNGTLSPFVVKGRCLLIVSQAQEVHEQIAAFLNGLRKTGGKAGKETNDLLLPTRTGHGIPFSAFRGSGTGMGGGMF